MVLIYTVWSVDISAMEDMNYAQADYWFASVEYDLLVHFTELNGQVSNLPMHIYLKQILVIVVFKCSTKARVVTMVQ